MLILLSFAAPAYASVAITEIMYDLEGSDTGREWIEIQNTGAQIDLTGWKFFENGTNHGLTLFQSSALLPENSFAVIADNAEKFLLDWPGFSGTIFDSTFSLSNTGETLTLRDAELADKDTATYSSGLGANGDGNSLQKQGSEWIAALPTPGEGQVGQTSSDQNAASAEPVPAAENDISATFSGSVAPLPINQIKAYAGPDRAGIAGGEIFFEGFAEGIKGDPLDGARFSWNFGDGYQLVDGKKIGHTFLFPGVYTVSLNVAAGEYSALDMATVTVAGNPLVISELKPGLDGWVEIKNNSARKIEISRFGFGESALKPFFFPENTFLAPYALVVLSTSTLGFILPESGEAKLLYPNGKIIFSSNYLNLNLGSDESLSFDGKNWLKTKITPGLKNEILKTAAELKINPPAAAATNLANAQTASVISIEKPPSFLNGYFWLFMGLGAGIFAGLIFVIIRRRFTL